MMLEAHDISWLRIPPPCKFHRACGCCESDAIGSVDFPRGGGGKEIKLFEVN